MGVTFDKKVRDESQHNLLFVLDLDAPSSRFPTNHIWEAIFNLKSLRDFFR